MLPLTLLSDASHLPIDSLEGHALVLGSHELSNLCGRVTLAWDVQVTAILPVSQTRFGFGRNELLLFA
jgi:hypothetical protein